MGSLWDISIPMFTAALFMVAKNVEVTMEIISKFISRWVDRENVAYTYDGILFSLKKERKPVLCDSMDKLWGY